MKERLSYEQVGDIDGAHNSRRDGEVSNTPGPTPFHTVYLSTPEK